jgi:hypothetical protein
MLSVDILLSVVLLSVIMPRDITLIVGMFSIIMIAVIRLFAIALFVIMTPTDRKDRIHNTSFSS